MHALIDQQTIIIVEGSTSILIGRSDPTFEPVRRYLIDERGDDLQAVRAIIDRFRVDVQAVSAEAVSVVDGDTDEPYRLVHGDPVQEVVLATAIHLANESADLAPLGAFLKRLQNNPSPASRSQLFAWLKAGGFTLTTDGLIVGYKSVQNDGFSSNTGKEPVTVTAQDGTVTTITGKIPYPVGATVSMDRDLVDDDRNSACSVGLHVGTFSYARGFSQKMLVVLVDPADVVSVPNDSSGQKMRVCKLFVAALNDGSQITQTVIDNIRNDSVDVDEDYEDYEDYEYEEDDE